MAKQSSEIDAYLQALPLKQRDTLTNLRELILETLPQAKETIRTILQETAEK